MKIIALDSLTITDSIVKKAYKIISDSVPITDSAVLGMIKDVFTSDSLTITDTINFVRIFLVGAGGATRRLIGWTVMSLKGRRRHGIG